MKTLLWSVRITGGAVLALAAVFVLLLLRPVVPAADGVVFSSAEPVDIQSVKVENTTGAYRY